MVTSGIQLPPRTGGKFWVFGKLPPRLSDPGGESLSPRFGDPGGGEVEKTSPPYGGEVSKKILRISDLRNTGLPLKNSVLEG